MSRSEDRKSQMLSMLTAVFHFNMESSSPVVHVVVGVDMTTKMKKLE